MSQCPKCLSGKSGAHPAFCTTEMRFWNKVRKGDGCWLWVGCKNANGYGSLYTGGNKKVVAHRFSYELHYGPVPKHLSVCHHCDVPACIRPEHLYVGTHRDNMEDRDRRGRTVVMPKAEYNRAGSCKNCGRDVEYRIKGRCERCHSHLRRHGRERNDKPAYAKSSPF